MIRAHTILYFHVYRVRLGKVFGGNGATFHPENLNTRVRAETPENHVQRPTIAGLIPAPVKGCIGREPLLPLATVAAVKHSVSLCCDAGTILPRIVLAVELVRLFDLYPAQRPRRNLLLKRAAISLTACFCFNALSISAAVECVTGLLNPVVLSIDQPANIQLAFGVCPFDTLAVARAIVFLEHGRSCSSRNAGQNKRDQHE